MGRGWLSINGVKSAHFKLGMVQTKRAKDYRVKGNKEPDAL